LAPFKVKNLATRNCVKDWGKVTPGRVREGDANFFRLGKVYSSRNYKDCHNVKVFSHGPLKLTCALNCQDNLDKLNMFKLGIGGKFLGTCQFLILPKLPQKIEHVSNVTQK